MLHNIKLCMSFAATTLVASTTPEPTTLTTVQTHSHRDSDYLSRDETMEEIEGKKNRLLIWSMRFVRHCT